MYNFFMETFEGKKAVVLGGSGGIGFEISRMLLKNGAKVVVHGRNFEKLHQIKLDFEGENRNFCGRVETVAFDFDREKFESLENSELGEMLKSADILCVCYGPFLQKSLEKTSIFEWKKTALLDYALPGFCVSASLPEMIKKHFGRILLFGGTGTGFRQEFLTNAAYAGAKTGLGVIVQSVACGFAEFGITCNGILPGFTETEYLSEKTLEDCRKKMPGKKLISRESVASAAEFLLKNPDLNGVLLKLDRGWSPLNLT